MNRTRVGILLFDDVEILDFAGPFEVFSRTRLVPGVDSRKSTDSAPYEVFTVAAGPGTITTTGGLVVQPHYSFASAPEIDLLLIPGGFGTRRLLEDAVHLDWIRSQAAAAKRVTSVCTGALLLARLGLLRGKRATTHWGALDLLGQLDPTVTVERGVRMVEDGIVTSAGVSAGIDMAFAVVASMHGIEVARETAHYIDYPWVP